MRRQSCLQTHCPSASRFITIVSHLDRITRTREFGELEIKDIMSNFFARYLPSVKASDEELVDPQKLLREDCRKLPKCSAFEEKLTTCNDRVNSRSKTAETCLEELFDYMHCVDHCVSKTLFTKLK